MGVNSIHERVVILLTPQDEIYENIYTLMTLIIIEHFSHGVNDYLLNNSPEVNIITIEDMDKYSNEVCIPIKINTKVGERTFLGIQCTHL